MNVIILPSLVLNLRSKKDLQVCNYGWTIYNILRQPYLKLEKIGPTCFIKLFVSILSGERWHRDVSLMNHSSQKASQYMQLPLEIYQEQVYIKTIDWGLESIGNCSGGGGGGGWRFISNLTHWRRLILTAFISFSITSYLGHEILKQCWFRVWVSMLGLQSSPFGVQKLANVTC